MPVKNGIARCEPLSEKRTTRKIRRLLANEEYFGLEALAFHSGADRVVSRLRAESRTAIDARTLAEDFRVEAAAGRILLRDLVAAGLLEPQGDAHYRPTALLHEYAEAPVVMPLTRERARTLIGRARELAIRINGGWKRNPYVIETIAVSGNYMSRDKFLKDLSLWLVLTRRVQDKRRENSADRDAALHDIGAAMRAISSFVVVRVASDRQRIARPFAIVFDAIDSAPETDGSTWGRLRAFGTTIRRRLR